MTFWRHEAACTRDKRLLIPRLLLLLYYYYYCIASRQNCDVEQTQRKVIRHHRRSALMMNHRRLHRYKLKSMKPEAVLSQSRTDEREFHWLSFISRSIKSMDSTSIPTQDASLYQAPYGKKLYLSLENNNKTRHSTCVYHRNLPTHSTQGRHSPTSLGTGNMERCVTASGFLSPIFCDLGWIDTTVVQIKGLNLVKDVNIRCIVDTFGNAKNVTRE